MSADFYRSLRAVDQVVHWGADRDDRLDGVTQREELDRHLSTLSVAARRLADNLRSYPPAEDVGVLYDGCEGEWEESAFVPVSMAPTPRLAKQAIPKAAREYLEAGLYLLCEDRCHLAPTEYSNGDEDWRYTHCRQSDVGAIEFWRVEIAERRFSLRRGLASLRWGIRGYRHQRKQGVGRRRASHALRIRLRPRLVSAVQRKWRLRKKRAAEKRGKS